MQDQHTGKPGTFYIDHESGKRITKKEWDAKNAQEKKPEIKKQNKE